MSNYTISPTFSTLFSPQPDVLQSIQKNMAKNGYDGTYPIILGDGDWTNNVVLIDGHTRAKAAANLSIDPPFVIKQFKTEDEALEYAIHNQRNRRNLTTAEFVRVLELMDERKKRGGDNNPYGCKGKPESKAQNYAIDYPPTDTAAMSLEIPISKKEEPLKTEIKNSVERVLDDGKSAEKMAKLFGVSTRKVEMARTVIKDAPEEIKQAVLSGDKTINRAYEEVKEIKKQQEVAKTETNTNNKAAFNLTNDNIEWAKWSWNPVTGCYHGCKYCYARDIAIRFGNQSLPKEKRFDYTVHRNRFAAPTNTKIPHDKLAVPGIHNVFVCSMADLFGRWVETEVIQEILDICESSPQWNYLFLTKNPKRLLEFTFPKNSWVGATVDIKSRVESAVDVMPRVRAPIKFISCEPFLEDLGFNTLEGIDWVIIGGCSESSGGPAIQPQWEWVEDLMWIARDCGCKIYFKPNLETRPKEYPTNSCYAEGKK